MCEGVIKQTARRSAVSECVNVPVSDCEIVVNISAYEEAAVECVVCRYETTSSSSLEVDRKYVI